MRLAREDGRVCFDLFTPSDIAQTRRHIRELTKVGEREIHEVVLS